ncbi:hypothetical protein AAG570_012369 [Ranatra chinensis]|uniref:Uncharacterized protein n=1 Tax=Ranatra chinensis TaxID=642074 RepID=A0ABD0YIS2_9HEMI
MMRTITVVAEVPGPPGVPFVSDTGRNWVTLSWSKPQPRGSTLMVAPVLAYRVDAWNTEEARWTELGVTPVNSMDVFNLKGEYRFRVTGRNRYGWGEGVTNVNPINIEGDLQMPEFVQDLPGQLKALLGHSVQLKCRVKGIPDPEIKWYRNGMDVSGRKECRWTEKRKGDACYLSCEEVCLEDEGRYRCEAANTLGRVATFARLQRLSEVEAEFGPQFTMRLRDRRVQLGHPVRLTCQIVASPPPQVVWTKDGQPIASTDGHVITSSSDGFHTLEITRATEEDGGEYCVSGKNEHGCLGCRAQLTVDKGLRGYIAPAFVSQVECVTAAAGGSELRLRARVEAYPSIGISW